MKRPENAKALGAVLQQIASDALFWRDMDDITHARRLREKLGAFDLSAAPQAERGLLESRRMKLVADLDAKLGGAGSGERETGA